MLIAQERSLQVQKSLTGFHKLINAGGLSGIQPRSNALIENLRLLCELLGSVIRAAFLPPFSCQFNSGAVVFLDAVARPPAGTPGLFDVYGEVLV